MEKLRIENIAISELKQDPNNARVHSQNNLDVIQNSLKTFGQRKPIVISHDNTVIAGNGTLTAAINLEWTEIAVARIPQDWSAEKIKAYALTDNRSAELAEWDPSILAEQLIDLEIASFDVSELGFTSETEMASFLDNLKIEKPLEDETPFVAPDRYPLPYGFEPRQREIIIKAINEAKKETKSEAPEALTYIAELFLED
jgi:ParB-like chromosome segregation protein Spo0J